MGSYDHFKKEIWETYSQLKPITCPVLKNDLVVFSRAGFNHLTRKGKRWRPQSDQARRFKLLPYVTSILESTDAEIVTSEGKTARFWKFTKKIDD